METDAAFYEIFEHNPDRLAELTGAALPRFAKATSQALKKTLKVECDMLFEPAVSGESPCVLEVQLYFDHSIFKSLPMSARRWPAFFSTSSTNAFRTEPTRSCKP